MAKVYLVQMNIVSRDKMQNFASVRRLLSKTSIERSSLIVLPEMFSTGFETETLDELKESFATSDSGETAVFLQSLADETGCLIQGGGIDSQWSPFRNFVGVYAPHTGTPLASFYKMHPFAAEKKNFVGGTSVVLYPFKNLTVSPFICYDLRFPEEFREATSLGANVFTVAASWPAKRAPHWRVLLQARAIENQCYVLGVNRVGKDAEETYEGSSIAIGPSGEIIGEADNNECVLVVDIEVETVLAVRKAFPVLADIRRAL